MTCTACGYNADAAVARRWEFFVPLEVESLNAHRVNAGGSRWGYKRSRDAWCKGLVACSPRDSHSPGARVKRRVTLVRIIGPRQRAFDRSNLIGGCKPVWDAMVRVGMLVDDTPLDLEDHYDQERGPQAGLRVLIEELA